MKFLRRTILIYGIAALGLTGVLTWNAYHKEFLDNSGLRYMARDSIMELFFKKWDDLIQARVFSGYNQR